MQKPGRKLNSVHMAADQNLCPQCASWTWIEWYYILYMVLYINYIDGISMFWATQLPIFGDDGFGSIAIPPMHLPVAGVRRYSELAPSRCHSVLWRRPELQKRVCVCVLLKGQKKRCYMVLHGATWCYMVLHDHVSCDTTFLKAVCLGIMSLLYACFLPHYYTLELHPISWCLC